MKAKDGLYEANPIVDEYNGCDYVFIQLPLLEVPPINTCRAYLSPEAKWMNGKVCPLASHVKKESKEEKFVDPIKASKRKMGK